MKPDDRNLGMDRSISRRDLLLGMGASVASAFIPGRSFADEMLRFERAGGVGVGYPPALTGMRGSHVGSSAVANHSAVSLSPTPTLGQRLYSTSRLKRHTAQSTNWVNTSE